MPCWLWLSGVSRGGRGQVGWRGLHSNKAPDSIVAKGGDEDLPDCAPDLWLDPGGHLAPAEESHSLFTV